MIRNIIQNAKDAKRCIISVMGPHAGENNENIFNRKINDIMRLGFSYWIIRSSGAKVETVQAFFEGEDNAYVIFVTPSTSSAAIPTASSQPARLISFDGHFWKKIPDEMSPVTGRIDKMTCGLVLDHLEYYPTAPVDLDLSNYCDPASTSKGITIMQGRSTVVAQKVAGQILQIKMKSIARKIIGVGKLKYPYAVWLQK